MRRVLARAPRPSLSTVAADPLPLLRECGYGNVGSARPPWQRFADMQACVAAVAAAPALCGRACADGCAAAQLFLLDENAQVMSECHDDKKLGYYSPYDGCRLHIVDLDPNSASAGGWLEDVSLVKKYEISEEAYNARENTYRNFRKKKLAEDPSWTYKADLESRQGKEAAAEHLKAFPQPDCVRGLAGMSAHTRAKAEDPHYLQEEAAAIKVGDRCQVAGGRRGEVMFVGQVPELPLGFWVSWPLSLSLSATARPALGAHAPDAALGAKMLACRVRSLIQGSELI